MPDQLDPEMKQKVAWMMDELTGEFGSAFKPEQIREVVDDSLDRLLETASVRQFVPLMAYRFSRERLNALLKAGKDGARDHVDIVYVSLSGGGRGQIAAALTAMLSDGSVTVHSAGTKAAEIDPGVRQVIGELTANPEDAFARPVTEEILVAADVIVTMGHSVGIVNLPAGIRHEDWRIGDPIGASVEEVRRVSADIEYRVRDLLTDLGTIASGGSQAETSRREPVSTS